MNPDDYDQLYHCYVFSLSLSCILMLIFQYERAATVLSVGGIRQQFSTRGNIEMSMYSCDFIKNIGQHLGIEGEDPPDVQFVEGGYLFLASQAGERVLRENCALQRSVWKLLLLYLALLWFFLLLCSINTMTHILNSY